MEKSCFMFGHSTCPDVMLPILEASVKQHYSSGARYFYVGHRGSFDGLATTAVKRLKEEHPEVRLLLVLSYHPAERAVDLWPGFDDSFYPPLEGVPRQYAIVRSNQYMIDTADSIICYAKHPGNARNFLEYARRRQKKDNIVIDNIADIF